MNIIMTRGDTYSKCFEIEYEGEKQDLETVYLTCRSSYDNPDKVFQKSLGNGIEKVSDEEKLIYRIRIAPEDTEDLRYGDYYYDLEIGLNGDKFTILKGILRIEPDITKEAN